MNINQIDRSLLSSGNTNEIKSVYQDTFRDMGFAYVRNHGISPQRIDRLSELSRVFFDLELSEKNKIAMKNSGLAWRGYFPVGAELTSGKADQKEGLYFGKEHLDDHLGVQNSWPLHGKNQWPDHPLLKDFSEEVLQYLAEIESLARDLMKGFAISLDLPDDYFAKRFQDATTLFRIFNYPKHKACSENLWGVGEHTDMGFLTVLHQDQSGGLEARLRDGNWIPIPPIEDTFVINIGDMMEFWTHGYYRATPHRVKNLADGDRLSIPFFYDPCWTASLEPIDKNLLQVGDDAEGHERWDGLNLRELPKDMTYGDFVWNKVKDVFPDLAEG